MFRATPHPPHKFGQRDIRCPLLRPDPDQQPRLAGIRDNLVARLGEAREHGWLGEVEGMKVSLAAAEDKLTQMRQIAQRRTKTVDLGMPIFGQVTDPHTATATLEHP
jgi:hypothetical protein